MQGQLVCPTLADCNNEKANLNSKIAFINTLQLP